MFQRFVSCLFLLTACATPGQNAPPPPETPPPLVERELFFDDPEIAGGQISPDGAHISFIKPYKGVMNIWVKARAEPFEAARPVTADKARPVRNYFWSRDGKLILYVQDKGGDENFHVYAVDPSVAADVTTGVPPARDLTKLEKVRAEIVAVPKPTPNEILVAINDRDPQFHDVYRIDLTTGKRDLLMKNTENVAGWVADLSGKLRIAERQTEDGGTEVLRIDGDKLTRIYVCTAEESCDVERFHKDGRRVYLQSNRGDHDLTRLVLLDVATGTEEFVEEDPEKQVDFGGAAFSYATDDLMATFYTGDRLRIYPRDPLFARDYEALRKALPEGDVFFQSGSADDRLQLVALDRDVDPGAAYLYDRSTKKVDLLYRPRPKLPPEHLAHMKPVHYTARDGIIVNGYLTVPKGVEAKNLPTIILPHGGPWGRDTWGYSSYPQFLANRGYAVLQPNFRGSTGYGKKFLNLGNGQWGTGTMQHDLSDGVAWLIKEGIADPKRIAIMGGSYGGYATLAGVAFTPDLYAAGVDIVGPSNIITLLHSIPPYWAPIRKMFDVRVGNPDQPDDVDRLKAQSPLYAAREIKAPLLVIQGANDPRVKRAEADQIVIALRDLGRPVEYLVAPDEGHGFARRENRLAMMTAIEKFLAVHLGGRSQESVPADIAKRLAEITVDPKTVTLVSHIAAAPAVFSAAGMKAVKFRYGQVGEIQGRKIQSTAVVTVAPEKRDGTEVWSVAATTKSSIGNASDVTLIDKKTLFPVSRTMNQGTATIDLQYASNGVHGKLLVAGHEIPIDANSDVPLVADGAALYLAISTLPLAAGYRAALHTFDPVTAKVTPVSLEVKATEDVIVPAGTFQALRVELAPGDGPGGTTVWVERSGAHRVVKWERHMDGGRIASELLQ
jgi:dipeptidyl aminopeptidase/acylaminoacyl peptidase